MKIYRTKLNVLALEVEKASGEDESGCGTWGWRVMGKIFPESTPLRVKHLV